MTTSTTLSDTCHIDRPRFSAQNKEETKRDVRGDTDTSAQKKQTKARRQHKHTGEKNKHTCTQQNTSKHTCSLLTHPAHMRTFIHTFATHARTYARTHTNTHTYAQTALTKLNHLHSGLVEGLMIQIQRVSKCFGECASDGRNVRNERHSKAEHKRHDE